MFESSIFVVNICTVNMNWDNPCDRSPPSDNKTYTIFFCLILDPKINEQLVQMLAIKLPDQNAEL